MGAFPYLQAYVVFKTIIHFFEAYLEFRQLQKTREKKIPEAAKGLITQKEFDDARAYQADKRVFSICKTTFDFFFSLILLLYISPLAWHKTVDYFGAEREIVCSLVWTFGLSWSGSIVGVGFSLYSDFVIEEKHGS